MRWPHAGSFDLRPKSPGGSLPLTDANSRHRSKRQTIEGPIACGDCVHQNRCVYTSVTQSSVSTRQAGLCEREVPGRDPETGAGIRSTAQLTDVAKMSGTIMPYR